MFNIFIIKLSLLRALLKSSLVPVRSRTTTKPVSSARPTLVVSTTVSITLFHDQNLTIPKSPPVPAQAMLPKLFNSFGRLSNTSDTLLFHSISISYKPFIALLEMMGMTYPATNLTGISAFVVFL